MMNKVYLTLEKDGFYGAYYENKNRAGKAMIFVPGNTIDDGMAVAGVKWLHRQGCNVLTMTPPKKDCGYHNYPLECFEKAISYLKAQGNSRIGIIGGSTTGMMALLAASYYPDITLTIAMTPPDFVMEGFYQDGLDGARERPGDHESTVSYQGKPLPYLPYAYRHPEYWQKIRQESKEGGDLIAARKMFDKSERRHPVQEEERIKIENINGKLVLVGAEDDVLWDTCKYIRRMEARLKSLPHKCKYKVMTYEHGTHFVFPESMLRMIFPVSSSLVVGFMFKAGRKYPKECKAARIDIDRRLSGIIRKW